MLFRLKVFFFISQILLFAAFGFAEPVALCPRDPDLTNQSGRLTGQWHLDFIGADLAKKYVAQNSSVAIGAGLMDSSLPQIQNCSTFVKSKSYFRRNLSDFEKIHGHLVAGFMAGPDGAAHLDRGLHAVIDDSFRTRPAADQEIKKAMSAPTALRVLNYSMGYVGDPSGREALLKKFASYNEQGIILVKSAGNDARISSRLDELAERFPGIVVGGLNSKGALYEEGQLSEKVFVMAPAEEVLAFDPNKNPAIKSGTSFAAPLVAGSIINALRIDPRLNRSTIEELIKKTSIKMPEDKGRKVPGMINSYKLVRIAERVKTILQTRGEESRGYTPEKFRNLLKDPALFDFSTETRNLLERAGRKANSTNCEELWSALDDARAAFLLSGSESAKARIISLYEKVGYSLNGRFYKNLPVQR